jgi:hypothetical protein
MKHRTQPVRRSIVLATILVLGFAGVALAGDTATVTSTAGTYQATLLDATKYNGTSTWAYSIQVLSGQDLDHWALSICDSYTVSAPSAGSDAYTTLASFDSTTATGTWTCTVVHDGPRDLAGSGNLSGIKFEGCEDGNGDQIQSGDLAIFQITVAHTEHRRGDGTVALKSGSGPEGADDQAVITSPVCAPLPVTLQGLGARGGSAFRLVWLW